MIRRTHPRRGRALQVIRHAAPEEALQAMTEPPTAPQPAVLDEAWEAAGNEIREVLGIEPPAVSRETSAEPPPLRPAQVAALEAATALWVRQVRTEGPADATLLFAAPRPPVPPPAGGRSEPPGLAAAVARTANVVPPTEEENAAVAEASRRLLEEEAAHDDAHALEVARRLEDLRPPSVLEYVGPEEGRPPAATPAARRVTDWASRHDPASLAYPVRDRLAVDRVPLQSILLEHGPILDQGTTPPLTVREASGCVGFAVTAAANALDASTRSVGDRLEPASFLDAEDARVAYRIAQERDEVAGEDYPGTSVLAGMKAGQALGYWDTYLWALRGPRDVAQALLQWRAPVVIGIPWDSQLEAPDPAGIIRPGGRPAGGHALAVIGIRMAVGGSSGPYFVVQQSRGTSEGAGGLVYLHHRDLANLLAGLGEAAVPLPRWGAPF